MKFCSVELVLMVIRDEKLDFVEYSILCVQFGNPLNFAPFEFIINLLNFPILSNKQTTCRLSLSLCLSDLKAFHQPKRTNIDIPAYNF